jgi:hypothetical protein
MDKLDLKVKFKSLFSPSAKDFLLVEVPPLSYLMIDGHGDPAIAMTYQLAVESLYTLSYTLKFHIKKTQAINYAVMPLEGLWWMPDMTQFSLEHKADWDWTSMILQPDFITPELLDEAKSIAAAKAKPLSLTIRLETLTEGACVQIMYFGAYIDEAPVIARMHAFIHENGYVPNGKHHEIYLSDPRRVAPEKNRTILRQPVKRV